VSKKFQRQKIQQLHVGFMDISTSTYITQTVEQYTMGPARKRQRTGEDGKAAISTVDTTPEDEHLPHSKTNDQKNTSEHPRDPRTLFIRLLAPSTTSEDLTGHFSQSYPIKHAVAVLDNKTKQCKGFGFVTFADESDASQALQELDGSELHGRKIKLERAQVRHRGEDEHDGIPRASKPIPERQPAPKLIVRNLPWSISNTDKLTHLFLSFGKVKEVILPRTADGKLRGFGIVLLRGRKNAEKALQSLNGREIEGRTLAIDWAVDKEVWERAKDVELESERHTAIISETSKATDAEDLNDLEESGDQRGESEDSGSEDHLDDDDVDEFKQELDVDELPGDNGSEDIEQTPKGPDRTDSTIFIRNLPFTCTDEDLTDRFESFGQVHYSRVVYDPTTEKPRGTGFVCFTRKVDAENCVKEAPRTTTASQNDNHSTTVLQDYSNDPSGKYTMDGRVLIISKAVKKEDADKLRQHGIDFRNHRDKDKRRLYLLNEGKIPSNSPIYSKLSASEIMLREASVKQRRTLVESNPSLHLSLTRLAIRNIPKFISSKDLKALAREAVVGFATGVKNGLRERLSKEELARGGDEMKEAERLRKVKGKGVVKQAKVVFESEKGSKIPEADGAGRSRGYGFIEYYTHRSALMGLRWLNGHEIEYKNVENARKGSKIDAEDRKKRLIVEFALENVNVVNRRREREKTAGRRSDATTHQDQATDGSRTNSHDTNDRRKLRHGQKSMKSSTGGKKQATEMDGKASSEHKKDDSRTKLARRQQIIAKKRMARRARKKGAS
jgi:nucleolar protein 4